MNESSKSALSMIRPKSLAKKLAELSALMLLVVTLLSLPARFWWLSDIFANLRMQILILGTVALFFATVTRLHKTATITVICCCVHLTYVIPELMPQSVEVSNAHQSLRLMTLNVLTDNPSYDAIGQHVRELEPDVLVLLEISRALDAEFRSKYSALYPHSVSRPQDHGNFGIAVYSNSPLTNSSVFQLNEMIDSIQIDTKGCTLIATHPLPPVGSRNYASRNKHLEMIVDRLSVIRKTDPDQPLILAGDLNLTPWSPIFTDFEYQSGLHSARAATSIIPTWYANHAWFPFGLVLDHVLVSEYVHCENYQTGPDVGSDHRSVCVDLTFSHSETAD